MRINNFWTPNYILLSINALKFDSLNFKIILLKEMKFKLKKREFSEIFILLKIKLFLLNICWQTDYGNVLSQKMHLRMFKIVRFSNYKQWVKSRGQIEWTTKEWLSKRVRFQKRCPLGHSWPRFAFRLHMALGVAGWLLPARIQRIFVWCV